MAGNGVLFYGVLVGSRNNKFNQLLQSHHDDWRDAVAAGLGMQAPDLPVNAKTKPILQKYERKRDAAVAKLGCVVDQERDQESGEYYIAIAEALYTGDAAAVAVIPTFSTKPRWRRQLKRACEILRVPFQEPGWFLTYRTNE